MTATFDKAFDQVIGLEGNYSNDPDDPGGETHWGISKSAYPNLDIKALTRDDAKAIYERDYWTRLQCEAMGPFGAVLFKQAVNQGAGGAVCSLQLALGLHVDAHVGAVTVAAIKRFALPELISRFETECVLNYSKSVRFPKYGRGWVRRAFTTAIEAFT